MFVGTCFEKVAERNPLMSIVVRNSEAICLKMMATKSHDLLKKNVKNLIQKIVTLKLINFETEDKALAQFGKFLANEATTEKKKFLDFKSAEQRLDDLYFKDFKVHENYPAFSTLLKIIFTLSHGQASVERGFNDNNVVLKDNISNVSVIARFLKNYMRVNNVEPSNMQISRDLVKSVKASRQRYQIHLEDEKWNQRRKRRVMN